MDSSPKTINNGHKILFGILCLLAIFLLSALKDNYIYAQKQIFTPQIPSANRYQKNKVFLEYADKLIMDTTISPDYQVLIGNVKFRKEGMFMYCDSAHFFEKTNSLDAFGNVRMEQGDTLFVYSDVMYYNGMEELARLRKNVKMENRDVTLFTDSLNYDMRANLGYYLEGGKIIDSKNELSSVYGQYEPDTKNAEFLFDVELLNDQFVLNTDTLHYNTNTHVADIVGKTIIKSDSTTIYSDNGWYNTNSEEATLYDRSLIVGKDGMKLTGDTLYYDKKKSFGEAFGNMVLNDSTHSSILEGNYGYHDDLNKISFATKRARAMEFSQKDTLYLHGDTIRTFLDKDSARVMTSYHKVRFFRNDLQGLADSLSFTSADSLLHMYRHPIVWNTNRQVMGNIIEVHLNDSTVDWAKLPDYGFVAEYLGEQYYNQLSGKEMIALFENSELRQLDVNGNVQSIFYPSEKDSTYNKLVFSESSFLKVLFNKKDIEKLTMWPEVTGKAIPLYIAKRSDLYLAGFAWYEDIRPKDKDDIFVIPEGMIKLFSEPEKSTSKNRKGNKPPKPNSDIVAPEKTEQQENKTVN
ncbi:MAG: OstA-like protein [Muribaculaceae bacterium]|nr:OstA-like protein [Muribaculaceae bacterium]